MGNQAMTETQRQQVAVMVLTLRRIASDWDSAARLEVVTILNREICAMGNIAQAEEQSSEIDADVI